MMKSKKSFEIICKLILPIAFVYGLILPFCWHNNVLDPMGTLSLLCEDRKLFFWLWGILGSGGIVLNSIYLYKSCSCTSRLIRLMSLLSFVGMCAIAATLGHSIADWNPKRVLHWIATGVFIVLTFLPLFLCFVTKRREYKSFGKFAVVVLLILACFAVIFIVVGKCALMEMVPMALMQLFLFLLNHTKLFPVARLNS